VNAGVGAVVAVAGEPPARARRPRAGRLAGLRVRALVGAWVGALAVLAATAPAAALPAFEDVRAAHRPSDLWLLDRHGAALQSLRVDPHGRRLGWVTLEDVSPALLTALVLSEDRRFWAHAGVDWRAVAASAWANAWNTRTRGASTLTMQLAGLLAPALARPAGGRDWAGKVDQARTALDLERRWSKAQILEAYLNLVPWRGELVGLGAMSQTLFGKFPHGLDAQEAAIAAALVRAPNAAPGEVARRACAVLREQGEPCEGVAARAEQALARHGGMPIGPQLAPQAAREALRQARGRVEAGERRLATTLDARVQAIAVQALRHQLGELAGRQVQDGAVVVLDNARGEVLAWVGAAGELASSQVDGVLASRQPGSTLKPFVYALAFEQRRLTAATLLADAPAQIATATGLYRPQNYERDFKGWVSVRTALGSSLNLPAVRAGQMVGVDALHARLRQLGLDLPQPAGHYGASLALGGADVSLLALANAYRAFATGGLASPPRLLLATVGRPGARPPAGRTPGATPVTEVTPTPAGQRVWPAAVAALVTDILADDVARAATFGLDSTLAVPGFAAVKTGTSKDLRDNWAVGYTDRYTVGVWVGNADGRPMQRVSGVSGAAPAWAAIVTALHAQRPSRRPVGPADAGLVAAQVGFDREVARHDAPRREWFLAGTEPQSPRPAAVPERWQRFGVAQPREGSVYALDPDIPPKHQRLRFEGEAGAWWLGEVALGRGEAVDWTPRPGRHELVWVSADGQRRQRVRFEVRAPWPASARPPSPAPSPPPTQARPGEPRLNTRSSAMSITRPHAL
jgi:penicillin-binding protein 1C